VAEQKSHAEQARETLDFAESMDTPESPTREILTALVQSQLAIAEELRGIYLRSQPSSDLEDKEQGR
jgi:type VI protein secretion system component VasK